MYSGAAGNAAFYAEYGGEVEGWDADCMGFLG